MQSDREPLARPSNVVDGAFLAGVDPRDGSALPRVPVSSEADVRSAVERAKVAQRAWAELEFSERARRLKAAAKRMLEKRAEILRIVESEIGKVPADALFTEALGPLDALGGWIRVIEKAPFGSVGLSPIAFPKKKARIEAVPRGVVGVIAPWNFPVAGLYRSVFPALLLGNAVVVKPSEHSPRSSAWFLEMLGRDLEPGLVAILQGDGAIGSALVESPIDALVFTGSSRVGQLVERRAFERGIPVSAEMGGNDAAIVLADADLPRTAAGLVHWALQNAGQACGAVEVVYVDSRVSKELTARLADAFSHLTIPPRPGDHGSVAPLAHEGQLRVVLDQIADAIEKGAELVTGGEARGFYLRPTLLAKCASGMAVVDEETFGPVLPIVEVDGPADAIRRVNAGKYGLTASIWSKDCERAERLAAELDVGVVTINNHAFTGAIAELPWSGRRASGRGIANSAWSLLTFARPKAIVVDHSTAPEPFWAPFDASLVELGERLSDAQTGKLLSAYKIPRLLAKRLETLREFFGIGR